MDRTETLEFLTAAYAKAMVEQELEPGSFYEETGLDEDAVTEKLFDVGRALQEPLGLTDRGFAVGMVVALGLRLGFYLGQALDEQRDS